MKLNRHGQGAIISDSDYAKIRKQIKSPKYRLLLDIARYTGERWGAIVKLRVQDIFGPDAPHEHITFRAATRKASPDGKRHTRQLPVHPVLLDLLKAYSPSLETSEWLFESPVHAGQPISLRSADFCFRAAVIMAGLGHKGYSTHSTRRTFVTRLYEHGVDLVTIQQMTGHHDLKALVRYIEVESDRVTKALAVL